MTADICWFHSESEDSEHASPPFDSRDAAIADGESTYDPGESFWVHKGIRVDEAELAKWIASRVALDCDDGRFEEDAEIGAEDPLFEMTKEDEEALAAILAPWARERKVLRTWYRWGTSESMTVPEDRR